MSNDQKQAKKLASAIASSGFAIAGALSDPPSPNQQTETVDKGVIHGGLFVSLVCTSAVSRENWVTTLDSQPEAADALSVYHGAAR